MLSWQCGALTRSFMCKGNHFWLDGEEQQVEISSKGCHGDAESRKLVDNKSSRFDSVSLSLEANPRQLFALYSVIYRLLPLSCSSPPVIALMVVDESSNAESGWTDEIAFFWVWCEFIEMNSVTTETRDEQFKRCQQSLKFSWKL